RLDWVQVRMRGRRGVALVDWEISLGLRGWCWFGSVEVVATAKTDLQEGATLDGIGHYMTYGLCENAETRAKENLLPIGIAEGCVLKRSIPKDQALTYDDVNPVFSPRAQVLVQAAKDLAEAGNELPFPSNYYRSGHISKYGAKALSARLSLLAKNYADAKAYSEEVLNGPFSFSANVTDVFNKLNDPELIWSYPSDTDGPPVTTFLPGQGKYHPFIRLAEMYLIKAEAMIYGGQFKDARNPLLIVAARRGVVVPEFDTQQTALDALYEISRIETYREGRRYANLVRWSIAGEVLPRYREHNNILPIPYQEIAKLPGLIQNPGYN
ncbi:MAG: RagB/SusD family nutrient uptake outer membrane protein, partial [Pedobacter sp.]